MLMNERKKYDNISVSGVWNVSDDEMETITDHELDNIAEEYWQAPSL